MGDTEKFILTFGEKGKLAVNRPLEKLCACIEIFNWI